MGKPNYAYSERLRELHVGSLVIVVEVGGVKWVRTRKRIVNLGFSRLARLQTRSTLSASLQTALAPVAVHLEGLLHLPLPNVKLLAIQIIVKPAGGLSIATQIAII